MVRTPDRGSRATGRFPGCQVEKTAIQAIKLISSRSRLESQNAKRARVRLGRLVSQPSGLASHGPLLCALSKLVLHLNTSIRRSRTQYAATIQNKEESGFSSQSQPLTAPDPTAEMRPASRLVRLRVALVALVPTARLFCPCSPRNLAYVDCT